MESIKSGFALRSRRVVVAGAERPATVVVREGRIAAIESWEAAPTEGALVDVGDHVVMPGLVDVHVHMNEPGNTDWEGAASATRAAAAGGVTTVIDMPLNSLPVTTSVAALDEKRAAIAGKCAVDVGFHAGLVEGNAGALDGMIDAGVVGVKAFLCHSGLDPFPAAREADVRAAMGVMRRRGLPLMVHAEVTEGTPHHTWVNVRDPREWLASRPVSMEIEAVKLLARAWHAEVKGAGIGAALHIVHISSARVVDSIATVFPAGVVSLETCPHYLFFHAEQVAEGDTRFKCAPPIRTRQESLALWQAIVANPSAWTIASDHSPCPPGMKRLDDGDFSRAWGGIASLQLGLSIMHTLAVERGGMGLAEIAQMMATRPAALVGLATRKGAISVGKDADLVVFDPDIEWVVEGARLEHRHPTTPYEGARLRGRVTRTWLRGMEIHHEGRVVGAPRGEFVQRSR